jgi:hypothetical protein
LADSFTIKRMAFLRNQIHTLKNLLWLTTVAVVYSCSEQEVVVPGETNITLSREDTVRHSISVSDLITDDFNVSFNLSLLGPRSQNAYYDIRFVDGGYVIRNATLPGVRLTNLLPGQEYGLSIAFFKDGEQLADTVIMIRTSMSSIRFSKLYDFREPLHPGSLLRTPDDGFIFTTFRAFSSANPNPEKGQLLNLNLTKTDKEGTIIWNRHFRFHTLASYVLENYSIKPSGDGGYVVFGANFVLKTDTEGNELWHKELGLDGKETIVLDGSVTRDNHILVGGYRVREAEIYIARIHPGGELLWEHYLPSATHIMRRIAGIEYLPDGNVLLFGTADVNGQARTCLLKTDTEGRFIWHKFIHEKEPEYHFARRMKRTPDGHFLICGYYGPYGSRGYASKINAAGEEVMQLPLTGLRAWDCLIMQDGSWLITGDHWGNNIAMLAKFDRKGTLQWTNQYALNHNGLDNRSSARSSVETADGGFAFVGFASTIAPWLVKTDQYGKTVL